MNAIRSILLILLTIVLVAFIAINWTKVPVNFWPLDDGTYLHFEWPVGFIVLISFIAGVVPMWLLHKGARWQLNRRIANLENSVRAVSATAPVVAPAPAAAASPLDAAPAEPHTPAA
ncbi:LapA family protein [Novosphingobium sp.]|uniref:LapA family protein n=1 Tax=Novosphingobium sp. TaxID=1874826 RepID=UPI0027348767|nr:LapA family protein [Novosphingobium sp.]MDP3906813.1 LapA family protein [Novosphingobium sp.]